MAKKEKANMKNKRSFFKDFKAELKKVIWLTPKQLINNTVAVIVIVLITAAIVFVLDIAFETLNKQGVERIKNVVGAENVVSDNSTTNNSTTENNTTEDTTENQSNDENVVVDDEAQDNTSTEENNAE